MACGEVNGIREGLVPEHIPKWHGRGISLPELKEVFDGGHVWV